MNRLILVGNGFDLAHGLKTSYKDFIFWYLDDCFDKAGIYPTTPYENEFVYIRVIDHYKLTNLSHILNKQSFCGFLHSRGVLHVYLNCGLYHASHLAQEQKSLYDKVSNVLSHEVKFKSDFFRHLIFCCIDKNWVDIENEYFDQLKACKSKDGTFDNDKVKQLNREFTYLKQKLEEYLTLQLEQANIKVISELFKAVDSKFDISDFEPLIGYEDARLNLNYDKTLPEIKHNLYFLNFNYTDTVQSYLSELNRRPSFFSKI